MKLHLGVIVKDGKIISHRSLFKLIFNPILRKFFGIPITSKFQKNQFLGYTFWTGIPINSSFSLIKEFKKSWNYEVKFDYIIPACRII